MKYFSTFTTTAEYNAEKSNLITPHVSLITENNGVEYLPVPASSKDYLTFVVLGDGKFEFTNYSAIQYSLDRGKTWTNLSSTGVTVYSGQRISWKANITSQAYNGVGTFSSTCKFSAEGNVMSLMYGDNFIGKTTLNGSDEYGGFYGLFNNNTNIVDAEYLQLPATTLKRGCYVNMFYGCTSLIGGPELLSHYLAVECYTNMFYGCTSLTKAPKLVAPHAENGCYAFMFYNCTSLSEVYCITYDNIENMGSNMCSPGAPTGTFYKHYLVPTSDFPIGTIPTDWTVVDIQ